MCLSCQSEVVCKDKGKISVGRYINPENSGNEEAECIIDCVAFFYEKGKGSEYVYYWSKNKFRLSAGKKKRKLSKLLYLAFGKFVALTCLLFFTFFGG